MEESKKTGLDLKLDRAISIVAIVMSAYHLIACNYNIFQAGQHINLHIMFSLIIVYLQAVKIKNGKPTWQSWCMIALLAGLIFNLFRPNFRGSLYIKLSLVCLLSLFVCTIGINTTGFYFYWQKVGFTSKFIQYVTDTFGTGATYWRYVCYRLFFGGQIWNCIANYALLFAVVPILNHIKPLKIRIS